MSDSGLFTGRTLRFGVPLLVLVLLVPAIFAGAGESRTVRGPIEIVLVAPAATQEMPSDRDTTGAPLLLLVPAGVVDSAFELPAPLEARLELREADRLGRTAVRPFPPPPPRRA